MRGGVVVCSGCKGAPLGCTVSVPVKTRLPPCPPACCPARLPCLPACAVARHAAAVRPLPAPILTARPPSCPTCAERVLPSIIQETLKSVIAQYNASQLLTMREVRLRASRAVVGSPAPSGCSSVVSPCEGSCVSLQRLVATPPATWRAQPGAHRWRVCCFPRAQVVSRDIRRILTQRARYFNIVLDDVSITQLTFRWVLRQRC